MVSSTVTCIDSALDDLKLLKNFFLIKIQVLVPSLRNLRTFLLCTRKWNNDMHLSSDDENNKDGSLGSLLVRIEDVVCKNAQTLHTYRLSLEDGSFDNVWIAFVFMINDFLGDIISFENEIKECYITLSDDLLHSSSQTADRIVEIIDSILENPKAYVTGRYFSSDDLVFLIVDALPEKLSFLRNLIRFSKLQGIEQRQLEDLLTRTEAVAINAANLLHMCQENRRDEEWWNGMELKISVLLQNIKPETYIQALKSSKIPASPLAREDDDMIITKDFIDSLVCILWEMLRLDTCLVVSMKDQLHALYAGLRFLRTSLKEQPNKFDEKTRDLSRVVICNAAIIIFSLSQTEDVETDLGLPDLLKRIEIIRAEVEENIPETSTALNFPRTNELGYVDFLLENLMEMTSCADSNDRNPIQTIQDELAFFRSFLAEISELRNQQEELQALGNSVMELAYKVEILMDSLVVQDIPYSFSMSFDSTIQDMRDIKNDIVKIFYGKRPDIKVRKATGTSNHIQSQRSAPIINELASFNVEATSIIDRLTRGSKRLRIVAIMGMPGIGKTTLATKVYNDPSVVHHFHVRAWCSVSHVFEKEKVLLELLNHIVPDRYLQITEQDLAETLRRHLLKRRYLIFLDDVWDIKTWESLDGTLPDDLNGSRVILTSRLHDVTPQAMLDDEPHFLHPLSKKESWELLQQKLFPENVCPATLHDIGMQIAENCKGLPLTIVIVAGLLANMGQEGWKEVLETLCSGIIYSTELCQNSIELSYKYLPDYLKPCFLYFGLFPEDQEIPVKRLIWLWNAEGFVRKTKLRNLEDVATDYVMDLISRSLVMVSKRRSLGGAKACRIHDLVHDFCKKKAEEENFFKILKGYNELLAFNEQVYLRRLCIQSKLTHFMESKLYCPHVRSLMIFSTAGLYNKKFRISYVIPIFKLLSVLDLGQMHLGSVFPSEVGLLVQLKYLAVKGEMEGIPSSIGNLSSLESFVVNSEKKMVSLPDSLWNLRKLRYLYISNAYEFVGFSLPIEDLDNCFDLSLLDSFSGAIIDWHIMEKQMKKFPRIRKLKCKLFKHGHDAENCKKVMVPDFLSRLESLELSSFNVVQNHIEFEFGFPVNLKRLSLSRFGLPWSKISTIGGLPNLEVLKLLDGSFSGETWNTEEGEFPKLRFLKLASLDIVRWTASDDQFLYLQNLVLEGCGDLEEIPSCLEYTSTLEMIEVSGCSHSLASSVKQIQEEQMSMGNLALKILIPPAFSESPSELN